LRLRLKLYLYFLKVGVNLKILITGGAGFIGSALIRDLLKNTSNIIINVDKLTYAGNLDSLVDCQGNANYIFENCDICDYSSLKDIFSRHQPDVVMHLAAESHVDRSINNSSSFIETNIIGTHKLLEASRLYWDGLNEHRKSGFRFHHISTDEVFGDLDGLDQLFNERTPYSPSSPYSASKASSDHLVRAWHRTYGMPIVLTNCSNNYGPNQFPEKLIPLTIINALGMKSIPIYGDGMQIRDWLYVDDHVRALYEVLTKGQIGETYNIGGHNEMTNIDVVRIICEVLDELVPLECSLSEGSISSYADLITYVGDRPGHDKRYAIDASKIKEELHWTPAETFQSGIRKTVIWYIENSKWWRRVLSGEYKNFNSGHKA
tara:strand:- start:452 stop:1579 length:1128 start_codon:yes stop_codon:yes gene_type:complete